MRHIVAKCQLDVELILRVYFFLLKSFHKITIQLFKAPKFGELKCNDLNAIEPNKMFITMDFSKDFDNLCKVSLAHRV